ncbi:MAG: orotate phosphoribosyltransferase [Candidatus Thermoplasmatota archaeon]|nr:orotate phosphoribosyltransferase [Candidatus Thermoplasmatota archaeon]
MTDDVDVLRRRLIEHGAIKEGDFVLTSGKHSRFYVDIKDACTDPEILRLVASSMARQVVSDTISGMELGAVPLVVATSLSSGRKYIIIRKERKHGTGKLNIGEIPGGKEVDIIEDVVTTGGSVLKSAQFLRDNGARKKRAYCVVDREEGGRELLKENEIELIPLIRLSEIRKS